jgi:hypothetical protein
MTSKLSFHRSTTTPLSTSDSLRPPLSAVSSYQNVPNLCPTQFKFWRWCIARHSRQRGAQVRTNTGFDLTKPYFTRLTQLRTNSPHSDPIAALIHGRRIYYAALQAHFSIRTQAPIRHHRCGYRIRRFISICVQGSADWE